MTSATIKPAWSAGGRHGEGQWMIIFAAVLLAVVGIFNLIDGIPVYLAQRRHLTPPAPVPPYR